MHKVIEPKVLYFGTPVVLVSTRNEDGSPNLAPFSSAWWLHSTGVLGMSSASQTARNLEREQECVLNLPSAEMADVVDRLALLTGRSPVPEYKAKMGFRYEPDKFAAAGLTAVPSDLVRAPRVAQCPIQLEASVKAIYHVGETPPRVAAPLVAIETRILRVHVSEEILIPGTANHIDPEVWNPLIMSFCEFFGLAGKLRPSRLAAAFFPDRASAARG